MRDMDEMEDKMVNTNQYKSNKYLIKITIPVFIETLLATLIGSADQLMIKSQSGDAYTAIGNVNQIINVFLMTFNVVAVASTILIAQYIGARNKEKVNQLYSLSFVINIIFGIFVTGLLLLFYNPIFEWLNYPDVIIDEAKTYIVWIGSGLILNSIMVTFSAFLKANGFMKECMYIAILSNVINIGGNALLLFGWFGIPKLGITGVSIASNFSKIVAVVLLATVYKHRIGVKITLKEIRPFPFGQLKKMLGIGIPSAGESFSFAFVTIVLQKFINKFGAKIIQAKVTVNLLSFVSWIFANAISTTSQVIVGYLMGAKDIEGTDKRFKTSRLMSMAFSFAGSLILFFLCEPICGIFIDDAHTLMVCKEIMFVEIFLEQGRAVNLCAVRSLQACGDARYPIILAITVSWIVAVGGGYILGVVFDLGIVGVWIAMAADEIIRGVLLSIRWKYGKWRKISLVGQA